MKHKNIGFSLLTYIFLSLNETFTIKQKIPLSQKRVTL